MGYSSYRTVPRDVFAALYLMEAAMALLAILAYKFADLPARMLLMGRQALPLAAGGLGFLASAAYLRYTYRQSRPTELRPFWLTVAANVVTLMLLLVTGEVAVRLFSVRASPDTWFGSTLLLPRSWEEVVAHNRELLARTPPATGYVVPDAELGWTVGPGRQGGNGLYASSIEGIRTSEPGVSYAVDPGSRRVALVGDSFTFGLEVRFEETWGFRMERELGPGVKVLNFGVDGYGVDQAYLRYRRDVVRWRPDLAILGLIRHDLSRSLAVYAFISYPEWHLPLGKPRFIAVDGRLELVNVPVPDPEAILAYPSVADLPWVDLDPHFERHEWEWRPYHHSYLARLLISSFRRRAPPRPQVSDQALETINLEILASFADRARSEGSIPLIVFFPSRRELRGDRSGPKVAVTQGLRARRIAYEDLTPCLSPVGEGELFIEGGGHYSPTGNAAVARCLGPVARALLAEKQGEARRDPD